MNSKSLYSDLSLVKKLKKGDKKAFEIIFEKYKSKLYFFALKYIHAPSEVEEIIQNTFISLWENREMLNELLSIKNYLYKSVVNHVYNYLKHEIVHQKYVSFILNNQSEEDEDNIDDFLIYDDLKKNLDTLIGDLPPKQQEIFRMSRIEGLSHTEIAEKLGLSIRSVENQIYRALKYIKSNLQLVNLIITIAFLLSI